MLKMEIRQGIVSHEYWYKNLYDTEDYIIDCPGGTVYLTDESASGEKDMN